MCNQMPFGFVNQLPNQNMFIPDFNNNYNNGYNSCNSGCNNCNNNSNCPCQQNSDIEQRVRVLENKVKNIENRLNISNTNDYQYQSSMYMM